jgi:dipeptidyl aminopeptidase/acylaminoacyl peptidase
MKGSARQLPSLVSPNEGSRDTWQVRRFLTVPLIMVAVAAGCGSSRHVSPRALLAYSNGVDIVLYDPGSRSRRTLVKGREPSEVDYEDVGVLALAPAWSPDGSRLAYVRFGRATWIEVAEVATGASRRVSHRLGDHASGYGLRWSPDGRWIAYRDQDAGEIWLAQSDGARERLVMKASTMGSRLGIVGWTRRGRLVVRTPEGRFVVRPESGRPVRYGGRFPPPTRAPDGRTELAVARDDAGNDQIVVEASSGLLRGSLTADRPIPGRVAVRSCCPRWSPDGRWVTFVRGGAVVVVGADGRRQRHVLEDAAIAGWSPDGRYLLVAGSLGGRSLWLFEPRTLRRTSVVHAYQLGGAAWRPSPAPRFASVAPPKTVPSRTVETPFPSSLFRSGHLRIRAIRPLSATARTRVSDLTPDGRLAALSLPTGSRYAYRVAVLDLVTAAVRRFGVAAAPLWWDNSPSFDPTGRRLLYRRWHELHSVSVATGSTQLVARDAGPGPFRWLRDGSVAYVDSHAGLVIRRPDGTSRRHRLRLPKSALPTVAIAPDGRRILYAKDCDVWLENIRSRTVRRFAHARYSPTRLSWSPTGSHVALASSWWADCDRDFDWYHAGTEVFDGRGRRLDRLPGSTVAWSADGRFLLTSGGVTGTETAALQPLFIDDLRNRRRSTLLASRSTGTAFVFANRGIAFGRYDAPPAAHDLREDLGWRLYVGQLIGTEPGR